MAIGEIHILHQSFCRAGGMEHYAIVLAASFKALGHQVVVHARKSDAALVEQTGIQLRPVRTLRFPRKLRDFYYFRKADRLAPPSDGLQIALSRVRARDICVCGGTHLGYLRRRGKLLGPFDRLQVWMETEAYRSARLVISHSNLCTQELLSLYALPQEKVMTLFPPVDGKFSAPHDATEFLICRERLGLPPNKIVFLFPSMGHRRKGLAALCEALSSFANEVILAVAGKPSQSNRWPFVRHLGYIDDMTTAYRAADFTALASTYEPFGLVGPESILCGTRLVFEKDIGCLAALKPEAAFSFSAGDMNSMRQAVASAIALARCGRHRLQNPADLLLYNPGATEHAQALLQAAASFSLFPSPSPFLSVGGASKGEGIVGSK